MNHYHSDLLINAPAADVYKALTTPEGLQSWWTKTCEIGTQVGAESTFHFGKTFKVMRIEALNPDVKVAWQCIDSHIHAPGLLTRTNEWIGTSIAFNLEPQFASSTLLKFDHFGLVPEVECFEVCSSGWDQFLGSLKEYAETGKGRPFSE